MHAIGVFILFICRQRIVKQAPDRKDGTPRDAECFRRTVKPLERSLMPPTKSFKFRAMVISGTEIPIFKNYSGNVRKMMVKIQCGKYEVFTSRNENNNGVVEWCDMQESEEIVYPVDLDQIPDVVVSICKGKGTETVPVAYKRFKFADLVKEKFNGETKWVMMEEDKALDALDDDEFPGSVLMRLGAGPTDLADDTKHAWKSSLARSNQKSAYQVRNRRYFVITLFLYVVAKRVETKRNETKRNETKQN